MKNLDIKYKHGHLYDLTSGKRVHLKDGAQFSLQGDDDNFMSTDPLNGSIPEDKIRSAEEMEASLLAIKNIKSYAKILDAGTRLQFRIGITKTKARGEAKQYHFECKLLEDLYFYKKEGGNENKLAGMFECHCIVDANPSDNIEFFEIVYGNTLSNLFEKTSMLFFSNQRSPAANAFKEFSLINNSKKTLATLRKNAQFTPV